MESYILIFKHQTVNAILFATAITQFWLPKSQIEIDGMSTMEDYETLEPEEELDVYIPDWLAEKHGLI